ncbi:hypothetical protein [Spiroplasma endosymbiont of Panorpa germanica]|uniref:hypothetical protein n=1 Tax=Spiroplasma endosymbiont of Panorpa germanica TaxID=3066314 RepID=UPI0030D3DD2D
MLLSDLKLLLKAIFLDENNFEVRDLSKSQAEQKYLIVVDQDIIDSSFKGASEIFSSIREIMNFKSKLICEDNNLEILFEVYNGY